MDDLKYNGIISGYLSICADNSKASFENTDIKSIQEGFSIKTGRSAFFEILESVGGELEIEASHASMPVLEKAEYLMCKTAETLDMPALKTAEYIYAPNAEEITVHPDFVGKIYCLPETIVNGGSVENILRDECWYAVDITLEEENKRRQAILDRYNAANESSSDEEDCETIVIIRTIFDRNTGELTYVAPLLPVPKREARSKSQSNSRFIATHDNDGVIDGDLYIELRQQESFTNTDIKEVRGGFTVISFSSVSFPALESVYKELTCYTKNISIPALKMGSLNLSYVEKIDAPNLKQGKYVFAPIAKEITVHPDFAGKIYCLPETIVNGAQKGEVQRGDWVSPGETREQAEAFRRAAERDYRLLLGTHPIFGSGGPCAQDLYGRGSHFRGGAC